MSLIDRVLKTLEDRRQRIIDGDINCIPSPLDKLSNSFPGIEREKYYLISGATKSAKTQITNYLFLPICYICQVRKNLRNLLLKNNRICKKLDLLFRVGTIKY